MSILPKIVGLKERIVSSFNVSEKGGEIELKRSTASSPAVENESDRPIASKSSADRLATVEKEVRIAQVEWAGATQSLLEEPPSDLPQRLILGGTAFCLTFLVWAWFSEIEKIGTATGKLVPQGDTYKIESVESAKIAQIAVKEGDKIVQGQAIAKLDSTAEAKEVERLQESLSANRIELERKLALLKKVETEVETYRLIGQAEEQSQQLVSESARAKIDVIQNLLAQQQLELAEHQKRQTQTEQMSALDRAKVQQVNDELAEHQQRLERLKLLANEGAISEEFVFQARQAQRGVEQQLIDQKLQGIGNIGEQMFQSKQSIRQMQTNLTDSQGELVLAQNEAQRLKAESAQKRAEQRRQEITAQQKVKQLELEIDRAKSNIAETKKLLEIAQNSFARRQLRSPIAGTVLAFNVKNTGKVLQPGETVAEIAPKNAPLVLSAVIRDRDAGFIEPGMAVQIKFDAYSYQDYGIVPGTVKEISSNTKIDDKLGSVYGLKIELERNYITDNERQIPFKPGQTASADIVIRRVRVIDVLLNPLQKLRKDGINL